MWHTDQGSSSHKCMSTLLNCWEGVRKGGGGGGGLHYSLYIMSYFKDLTQKLVKSFITNQNKDMSRHIVKSFLANRENRQLHYKHIVKSRKKTCPLQTTRQIKNAKLLGWSSPQYGRQRDCEADALVIWGSNVTLHSSRFESSSSSSSSSMEEEEEEESTKKKYQQGRWHDTPLHANLQWQHSRNPLQLLLTLADEYLLLHKVQLVVVVVQLPWLVQEKCLLKSVLLLVVLLLLFCRRSQELVAQEEEALLTMVEKESSVSVAHKTTTHTYLLTYIPIKKILKIVCCSVLFSSQNKTKIGFLLISRRNTPRFTILTKEEEETTCRFPHY